MTSRLGLFITLLADLFLVAMIVLMMRFRPRSCASSWCCARPRTWSGARRARCWTRIAGQRYIVTGDVVEIEDDEMVLDLGDRRVRVLLDGHPNPAGYQQPVRATGYMIA